VLGPKEAFFAYHFLKLYHRRFQKLADLRRETGEEGRRNDGRRIKAFFDLGLAPWRMVARGVKLWLAAELDGVRLRLRKTLGLPRAAPAASAGAASEPLPGPRPAAKPTA
jgi:hypothetical protein